MHTRGEISRASLDLRQIFLHPRTAIEEPDKVVGTEFRFTPSPLSSPRASRGQTRWRIFAPSKRFFKFRPNNFEARFEGNGKTRVLFCAAQTPGLHFIASVNEYSYEQTVRIYMLTRAGRYSDNYVTPVLAYY